MNKIKKMVDGRLLTLQEEYDVKKRELADSHNKMVVNLQTSLDTLGVEVDKTERLIKMKQAQQIEYDLSEVELIDLEKKIKVKLDELKLATGLIEGKNKQLDEYKEYLTELSGKLTTRLRHINEMAENVNEKMSKKMIEERLDVSKTKLMKIPF